MKFQIYNTNLNPDIWDGTVLKRDIRQKLTEIANDFYKQTELIAPIRDILLVGSLANYNWSKNSDFDVHLSIDFKNVDPNVKLVEKYVAGLKTDWNNKHDIHLYGYNVEVYIQDITKTNRSSGVYSLMRGDWISKPKHENFEIDQQLIQLKYNDTLSKINGAIKENNDERIKQILKDVYDLRQQGLDRTGELSNENLVFKLLRNRGHLDRLRNATVKIYDKQKSLKESQIFNQNKK